MTAGTRGVAVVGAGIGGLTLAAALARVGISCRVFERAQRLGEVGAGLQLTPNAVRLLHRLGLSDPLRRHAVLMEAIELRRWDDDRTLARTMLGEACRQRYGAPYYTIHRAHLHAALCDLVGPATVHIGHRLVRLSERADDVSLSFEHGANHAADLAVGADGIRSIVRQTLVADAPVFSGHAVYRGLVDLRDAPEAAAEPRVQIWLGPGQHFVCYPVDGGRQISFAATVRSTMPSAESWSVDGCPAELTTAYRGWNATVNGVIRGAGTVKRWALNDREPLRRWSSGRLTLLGDAAHPMLPFLAQGANQAIEDAFSLAVCLSNGGASDHGDALRRYESVRMPRTATVQRRARERGQAVRLPGAAAGRERDTTPQDGGLSAMAWLYDYDAESAADAAVTRSTHPGAESRRCL